MTGIFSRVTVAVAILSISALPTSAQGTRESSHTTFQAHIEVGAEAGDLVLEGLFSRATLPRAANGGVYFSITNNGVSDDRLLGASTPVAREIQIHSSTVENDIMRMREVPDGVVVPAGGTVAFEPSGLHLMLLDLNHPLVEGETIPMTLEFEQSEPIEVEVPIAGIAAREASEIDTGRNRPDHGGH